MVMKLKGCVLGLIEGVETEDSEGREWDGEQHHKGRRGTWEREKESTTTVHCG